MRVVWILIIAFICTYVHSYDVVYTSVQLDTPSPAGDLPGICVDPSSNYIISTDVTNQKLWRMGIEGGEMTQFTSFGWTAPEGCTFDPSGLYLYVSDQSTGKIYTVTVATWNVVQLGQ